MAAIEILNVLKDPFQRFFKSDLFDAAFEDVDVHNIASPGSPQKRTLKHATSLIVITDEKNEIKKEIVCTAPELKVESPDTPLIVKLNGDRAISPKMFSIIELGNVNNGTFKPVEPTNGAKQPHLDPNAV